MRYRYFNLWFLHGHISSDLIWIRVGTPGVGIAIKRTRKLFSERYGFRKSYPIGFGWRIEFLKRMI